MNIIVNNEVKEVPDQTTVAGLLALLGLDSKTVALLRNDQVVERTHFNDVVLLPNDVIELVRFVGGG